MSLGNRIINLLVILIPFAAFIWAVVRLWGIGFNGLHLSLMAGMYLLTAVGITVGWHRLFTHRSFETNRIVRGFLGIAGSMAVQGPLFEWVANHRLHHQHSDHAGDPHSPHEHGHGLRGMLHGLFHAHMGWIFDVDASGLYNCVGDLKKDALLRFVNLTFPLWALVGLLLPAAIGGFVTKTWTGAALGLLWGGLVRIFLVHHVTWSINSVCHVWGSRPFRNSDESRNNFIFGVLGMGEGWHNNHHAFPNSARHGLRWWQIDISYGMIRGMELLGLARKVRLPAPAALAAKKTLIANDARRNAQREPASPPHLAEREALAAADLDD